MKRSSFSSGERHPKGARPDKTKTPTTLAARRESVGEPSARTTSASTSTSPTDKKVKKDEPATKLSAASAKVRLSSFAVALLCRTRTCPSSRSSFPLFCRLARFSLRSLHLRFSFFAIVVLCARDPSAQHPWRTVMTLVLSNYFFAALHITDRPNKGAQKLSSLMSGDGLRSLYSSTCASHPLSSNSLHSASLSRRDGLEARSSFQLGCLS